MLHLLGGGRDRGRGGQLGVPVPLHRDYGVGTPGVLATLDTRAGTPQRAARLHAVPHKVRSDTREGSADLLSGLVLQYLCAGLQVRGRLLLRRHRLRVRLRHLGRHHDDAGVRRVGDARHTHGLRRPLRSRRLPATRLPLSPAGQLPALGGLPAASPPQVLEATSPRSGATRGPHRPLPRAAQAEAYYACPD